jgi:hypothetical protein
MIDRLAWFLAGPSGIGHRRPVKSKRISKTVCLCGRYTNAIQ